MPLLKHFFCSLNIEDLMLLCKKCAAFHSIVIQGNIVCVLSDSARLSCIIRSCLGINKVLETALKDFVSHDIIIQLLQICTCCVFSYWILRTLILESGYLSCCWLSIIWHKSAVLTSKINKIYFSKITFAHWRFSLFGPFSVNHRNE